LEQVLLDYLEHRQIKAASPSGFGQQYLVAQPKPKKEYKKSLNKVLMYARMMD